MHSVQSASHLKSNNRVTSRVAVSGPTGRSPSLCTSGHLVTVAALRTFTPSLRCLTNRKRGLISARRARAAKKRKKRKRKKRNKSKKRLLNDNPSPSRFFPQRDTLTGFEPRINSFGYGIYLQGPHLLGTVMVVSI